MNAAIGELIFVGLNGYAVALNRRTGDIVWSNNQMHGGYVTLLLDGDQLIVSTNGYIYALEPPQARFSGTIQCAATASRPTSLASVRGSSDQTLIEHAQ